MAPLVGPRKQLVLDLREVIAALDRRVPEMGRANEASIMRDAAELRRRAVQRLAETEAETD